MKKVFVPLVLVSLAAAAVVVLVVRTGGLGGQRPNVLLITLDTTRADRVGCYGCALAVTPALDALAAKGVLFDQALCSVPLTLPSHATMMTGLQPPEHGLRINGTKRLAPGVATLAERLKEIGYETGAFIAAFALDSKFGLDRGFDTYDDDLTGAYEQDIEEPISVYRAGNLVADSALKWLEARTAKPFFCWVHLYDPHKPYHAHEALSEGRFSGQTSYDAEIAFMDMQVRRLTSFLERKGLDGRTLVIAVGDHGEGLSEHGEADHGYMLYNTTVQVPLVFSLPGRIPEGVRVGPLVSLVDLMPTVLDFLGMDRGATGLGGSLAAALSGGEVESRRCYGETDLPYAYFGWSPQRSLTTEAWKYVRTPRVELYDRRKDPTELENLAGARPDIVKQLEAELSSIEESMAVGAAEEVELEADEKRRLESLGYVGGGPDSGSESTDFSSLRDIKDMLPVIDKMWEMIELRTKEEADRVVTLCRELVRLSPESTRLQCYLGDALRKAGQLDEAAAAYQEALAIDANHMNAHQNLGLLLTKQGKAAEALKHFVQAVGIDPESAEARYNLGVALVEQGKTEEAIAEFSAAVRIKKDYVDAHKQLGVVLAQTGDLTKAIEHLSEAVRLRPENANAQYNLGLALAKAERYAEAAVHYRASLRMRPGDAKVHNNLGIALGKEGKTLEALQQYRAALQIKGDHINALNNAAWMLATCPDEGIRDGSEAVRLAEKASQLGAGNERPEVLDVLAAAYAEAGEFAKATATAKRAMELASAGGNTDLADAIAGRLALYRSGRAYREEPGKTEAR